MNAFRSAALLATATTALASAALQAQGRCEWSEGRPFQLASARTYLNTAAGSGKEDEKPKHLRNAVKVLTENADRIGNPIGRDALLGKVLLEWTRQPVLGWRGDSVGRFVANRGELGYTTDPQGNLNVILAIDSAFTRVETAMPQCADSLARFRRQLWAPMINRAAALINANQLDSAAAVAEGSLVIYRRTPHAYQMLWQVAQRKNDNATMMRYLRQTVEASGDDTSFRTLKSAAMLNIAVLTANAALDMEGAARQAKYAEAATMFRQYLAVDPSNATAQAGLAQALAASGDTAAVAGIYRDMLSNPSRYSYLQLASSGYAAAQSNNTAEAIQLYEASLAQNAYFRDLLQNLAAAYLRQRDFAKMLPIAQRLVEVDPNNPAAWRTLAAAYQGRVREASAAQRKALEDSVLAYIRRGDSLPVTVMVEDFSHSGSRHTIEGMVQNRGTQPGTYSLRFSFLDAKGAVAASQVVEVGPVPAKGQMPFKAEISQAGVVAFRYEPLR